MNSMMSKIGKHADLAAAGGIVLIVAMLIIPLPPLLLDFFITLNISAALMIVVATMYVPRALDFSSFPTILLLTTLFRLAINVSVTRLILLEGARRPSAWHLTLRQVLLIATPLAVAANLSLALL